MDFLVGWWMQDSLEETGRAPTGSWGSLEQPRRREKREQSTYNLQRLSLRGGDFGLETNQSLQSGCEASKIQTAVHGDSDDGGSGCRCSVSDSVSGVNVDCGCGSAEVWAYMCVCGCSPRCVDQIERTR